MGIYDRDYLKDGRQPGVHFGSDWTVVGKIIAVNVVVYLASKYLFRNLEPQLVASAQSLAQPWKCWQLLTYGFVHDLRGIDHILWNMFGLFVFGSAVERVYGPKEFLRIYLAAIVVGGLVFAVGSLATGLATSVEGASGAVTAIVLLYCIHFPRNTILLMFVLPVPAWAVGLFIVLGDMRGLLSSDPQRIAYDVHLAGAVFAIAYYRFGWNFGRILPKFPSPAGWLKPRPKLKIHSPTTEDRYRSLDAQADQILEKVKRDGVESLSSRERQLLEDYSRRMRQKHS